MLRLKRIGALQLSNIIIANGESEQTKDHTLTEASQTSVMYITVA
ncbi:MAG: hypothetical protein WBL67_19490 [Nitrososphaeraceae archaeon]